MKKFFLMTAMVAVVLSCFTSCYYESYDTFVKWGFAEDTDSEIVNGLETLLPSAQVIFDAFDNAFLGDYEDLGMSHEALMRAQNGKSKAIKNAKKTAESALSMIDKDHTCPVDYIFVVRIRYDVEGGYETVWSHDFRAE